MISISLSWCKKLLIYAFVLLLIVVLVSAIFFVRSIVHVKLPHGATLHVLPALDNKVHGAVIICPGGGIVIWKNGLKGIIGSLTSIYEDIYPLCWNIECQYMIAMDL